MVGKLIGALLVTAVTNGKAFSRLGAPHAASLSRNLASRKALDLTVPRALASFFPRDLMRVLDDVDFFPTSSNFGYNTALSMDVKETKDAYELMVDIPGIESKDVDIKVKGHDLTISAHREQVKKQDEENYHRIERYSGHITRTVELPENVDRDNIDAEYKNGVLHVTIKKTHEHPALEEKKIEVKSLSEPQQKEKVAQHA